MAVSIGEGEYLNAVGFAGAFVLCLMALYAILKRRAEDRANRW